MFEPVEFEDDGEDERDELEVRDCAVYWDEDGVCCMLVITFERDFHIRMSEEWRNKLIDGLMDPLGEVPDGH